MCSSKECKVKINSFHYESVDLYARYSGLHHSCV
jgi:hypothetical protein